MSDRIVSLAPSATRVVRACGAADRLVGLTTHDDTESELGGWLTPDLDAVVEADPDVVLTTDQLQAEIAARLRGRGIDVVHKDPRTLAGVETYIRDLGAAIGRADAADAIADAFAERLAGLRERYAGSPRAVVYSEEWGDPPMVAGNWVPELVEVAGGRYPFCAPGDRSRPIDREEIEAAEPRVAVLHHCGRGDAVSPTNLDRRGWDIPTVRAIPDDLLNQPGPQLCEAAARIGAIIENERP